MTEQILGERSAMFRALGDPTRLTIFDFLRLCCCEVAIDNDGAVRPASGPTVGEVCCHVTGADKINSTISHHLKELRLSGLITIERRGKNMICGVNKLASETLSAYLSSANTECSCDCSCESCTCSTEAKDANSSICVCA